jgi:ATP-dependent Clp protease ATP-binding subunit ClpB
MAQIVKIQLQRLQKRLEERKIALSITDEALEWLAEAGYDPLYGARPLKRVIQRTIQDPLALMLLEGDITEGSTLVVQCGKEGLVIEKG